MLEQHQRLAGVGQSPPNSDRVRERRGMFASAGTQAAWQISNLARGRDNAVPPFRVRSRGDKRDEYCTR